MASNANYKLMSNNDEAKLRESYHTIRNELESCMGSNLTLGEIHFALTLLNDQQTPHNFREKIFVNQQIEDMRSIINKASSYVPPCPE